MWKETLDDERKRNGSEVGGQDREGRVRSEGEQATHRGCAVAVGEKAELTGLQGILWHPGDSLKQVAPEDAARKSFTVLKLGNRILNLAGPEWGWVEFKKVVRLTNEQAFFSSCFV